MKKKNKARIWCYSCGWSNFIPVNNWHHISVSSPLFKCILMSFINYLFIFCQNFKSMFVICSRWWIESHFSPDMEQGIQTTLKDLSPAIQHAIEVSDSSSPLKQAVVEFLVAVPTKYLSVGIFYRQVLYVSFFLFILFYILNVAYAASWWATFYWYQASTPDNSESFSDRGPEEIQTSLQDMALVGNLVGYLQRLVSRTFSCIFLQSYYYIVKSFERIPFESFCFHQDHYQLSIPSVILL